MRVASAQFSLRPLRSSEEFWRRLDSLAKAAARKKTDVLLLPEYFSLGLAAIIPAKINFYQRLRRVALEFDSTVARICRVAAERKIAIIAGTLPAFERGRLVNRCPIVLPGRKPIYQDKIQMTRFEAEEWRVSGGKPRFEIFKWGGMKCAVAICYDVEFPGLTQALARQRVEAIFVPSCTDDKQGYWRVRHCAQARAIENQSYVIMSSIVGGNEKFPEINGHYGRAGVFSPCDVGFPEAGVIATSGFAGEGLVYADLSAPRLKKVRTAGTVLNLRDALSGSR